MNLKKITAFSAAFMLSVSMTAALPELVGISENACTVSAASSKGDFVIKTDSEGKKYVESYTGKGGDIKIPSGVDYIGEKAFYGNIDVTGVTFPKSCTEIKDSAFWECLSIKYVTFEGNAKICEGAFSNCGTLEKVTVKGSIEEAVGKYAFKWCEYLKTVTIIKNQYSFKIDAEAFYRCISLTSIKIPSKCTEIGNGAFYSCKALESISLPGNCKKIDGCAFEYCTSLKSITIPDKCTEIGDYAFLDCFNLRSISIPAKSKLGEKSIGFVHLCENENDNLTDYYVPDGKKSWYDPGYGKVTPKRLTATVVKGSPAEKYCKENGIKYKHAKTAKK